MVAQYADLPFMPLYVVDWLTDSNVSQLNLAEQGVFLRMLLFQWREGRLPVAPNKICQVCGVDRVWWRTGGSDYEPGEVGTEMFGNGLLDKLFPINDGYRRNERLEEHRMEQLAKRKMLHERGLAGARGRWQRQKDKSEGNAQAERKQSSGNGRSDFRLQSTDLSEKEVIDPNNNNIQRERSAGKKRSRASARGRVTWDPKEKKLKAPEKFRMEFLAVWKKEFTEEEITEQVKKFTRWLAQPKNASRRRPTSKIDQSLHNWMEIALEEKTAIEEEEEAMQPEDPTDEKQRWCSKCRNDLPNHAVWCPEVTDHDTGREG